MIVSIIFHIHSKSISVDDMKWLIENYDDDDGSFNKYFNANNFSLLTARIIFSTTSKATLDSTPTSISTPTLISTSISTPTSIPTSISTSISTSTSTSNATTPISTTTGSTLISTSDTNVCVNSDNFWCNNCKKQVNFSHKCFILQEEEEDDENDEILSKKKKKENFNGLIFFDYEARTCPKTQKHIPDLIVSKSVCRQCLSIEDKSKWCDDDLKFNVFEDNNKFGDWLFSKEGYIAIAHNFKGYDSSFIMSYIYDNLRPTDALPNILAVGTKILSIKFRKVKKFCFNFAINIFELIFFIHFRSKSSTLVRVEKTIILTNILQLNFINQNSCHLVERKNF
jgi:hypothetical protein